MRILGLRTRHTARGSAASLAADAALKTGATDPNAPPKDKDQPGATDEENKDTGATDDENKETGATDDENKDQDAEGDPVEDLDENGNPIKPPAAKAKKPVAGLKGNARVKAILQAPGASAQRELAEFLALDTEIDSAVAADILGKVKATGPATPAGAKDKPTFLAAMEKVANPKTPSGSAGAPKSGTPEAAVTELTSTFRKFGLSR